MSKEPVTAEIAPLLRGPKVTDSVRRSVGILVAAVYIGNTVPVGELDLFSEVS